MKPPLLLLLLSIPVAGCVTVPWRWMSRNSPSAFGALIK
jgi:hypothetical protein